MKEKIIIVLNPLFPFHIKQAAVFLLLVLTIESGYTQKIIKETKTSAFILGFHTAGQSINLTETDPDINAKPYHHNIIIEPYLACHISPVLSVGAIANFQMIRSNIKKNDDLHEIGGFLRYYIPIKVDVAFVRRMSFYTEASARVANYQQYSNSEYLKSDRFHYMLYTFNPLGVNFRIWKGLNVDFATELFFRASGYNRFGVRIGLEYQFNTGRRKE